MKKLIVVACALSLAGCATAPMQKILHRPVMHHVAPVVAPDPAPVVVTPSAAPVVVTKMGKPRWYDRVRSRFHKKDK